MKPFHRLTARVVLVPFALLVLAFGSSLPASAAPLSAAHATAPRTSGTLSAILHLIPRLPDSLNW